MIFCIYKTPLILFILNQQLRGLSLWIWFLGNRSIKPPKNEQIHNHQQSNSATLVIYVGRMGLSQQTPCPCPAFGIQNLTPKKPARLVRQVICGTINRQVSEIEELANEVKVNKYLHWFTLNEGLLVLWFCGSRCGYGG